MFLNDVSCYMSLILFVNQLSEVCIRGCIHLQKDDHLTYTLRHTHTHTLFTLAYVAHILFFLYFLIALYLFLSIFLHLTHLY